MRLVFATILLLKAGFSLYAQDLTGQWTGHSISRATDDQQRLVLDISATDSLFGGVMHWYNPGTQDFRRFIVSGHFHGDSLVSLVDNNSQTGNQLSQPSQGSSAFTNSSSSPSSYSASSSSPSSSGASTSSSPSGASTSQTDGNDGNNANAENGKAPGLYTLHYKRVGHKEVLEGHWRGASPDHPGQLISMNIRLERKLGPLIPPIVIPAHQKADSAEQQQYLSLLSRQSPVAATISVKHQDSVELELYDNGEIDGDSVSLYMNGQLILEHLKLDSKPRILKLALDKSLPVNKLILFAENLGTLPPNTALMEVNINDKKYNVFLSTDFHRNAMVEFALTE